MMTADVRSDLVVITDESTRAEIAEVIAHLRTTYRRGPQGPAWQDLHHRRLNALLDDYERAPE